MKVDFMCGRMVKFVEMKSGGTVELRDHAHNSKGELCINSCKQ